MALRKRLIKEWPAWRYGPNGEADIFNSAEEVPEGWMTSPDAIYEPPIPIPEIDEQAVVNQLKDKIDKIDPRWGKQKLWEELQKAIEND